MAADSRLHRVVAAVRRMRRLAVRGELALAVAPVVLWAAVLVAVVGVIAAITVRRPVARSACPGDRPGSETHSARGDSDPTVGVARSTP